MSTPRAGFVSIVGAGPGDPGLLTRKAIVRLRAADMVLYDALIDPRILRYARKSQRFFVGKRSGHHAMRQDTINRLLVEAARKGKHVVRLKGGDPFVFGRGGEEALALRAAGIPYDVIPGVSAATAAAALSGIPVTHRGLASSFLVVSGHDPGAYEPVLWSIPVGGVTLVVLMGLASRGEIADLLLLRGWPPTTPAAVLADASTSRATQWIGTLQEIGRAPVGARHAAGTIVIGKVVSLASRHHARPHAALVR